MNISSHPGTLTASTSHKRRTNTAAANKRDSAFELGYGADLIHGSTMAGSPFIKPEPNEFAFDPNQYMQFGQNYGGGMNINPANLSNANNMNNFGQSFNIGGAGIADDELEQLSIDQGTQQGGGYDFNQGMRTLFNQRANQHGGGMFSHTPDGAPMQSPFTNDFSYGLYRQTAGNQAPFGAQSMPQPSAFRPQLQRLDRKASDTRSPATPNMSGMNQLRVNDDFSHPGMQAIQHQRQQGSVGNGWDSTPSHHSWNESSPFPSPSNGPPMPSQISEVLKTEGQHHPKVASSLPTKMEGGSNLGLQSQEMKRRRRRESHNLVERRRRDNINERIQDLGHLIPQHRLEDEKVRKHLQTNAPLSPSITNAGLSPPAATSLLAGPQGRRATGGGNITQGLPLEDKDKGPNKGDILNGSVAWMRDLMWYLEKKMNQEQQLKQLLQQNGSAWPFETTEDERRILSEINEVMRKHTGDNSFSQYSRAPGSGLRVPHFTNVAGESLNSDGQSDASNTQQQSISPGFQPGGSGMSSGNMSHQHPSQFWDTQFKEEDEYDEMDDLQ